jgi:hypothetical protein
MRRSKALAAAFAALLGLAGVACAGRAWESVREQDTPGAYRRYLAEAPNSEYAPAAQERLDYLTAKRNPTSDAVGRFRVEHPESPHLPELESLLESRSFEAARVEGSAAAYRGFLSRFPSGQLAARANANLAYLLREGFSVHPSELVDFLADHPDGDHASEGRRSLTLLEARRTQQFRSAALRIEIDSKLGDAERLRQAFSDHAHRAFAGSGVRLVGASDATAGALLTIEHSEASVPTELYEGRMEGPGILATTKLSLTRAGESDAIWAETFTLRVPELERRNGSVLFTRRASSAYWASFFVPVATWSTQSTRRGSLALRDGAVMVAGTIDRALALFRDGSFLELDLADPMEPRVVGEYGRRADLSNFVGLRVLGERVVLFGDEGLELVDRNAGAPRRLRAIGRAEVGAVVSVEEARGTLWIAGSRGLLRTPLAGGAVETVAPRPLHGLAVDGAYLYVVDDRMLHATPLTDVRAERFRPVLDLGRTFGARGLRASDGFAVVLGRNGIVTAALVGEDRARPLARLEAGDVGRVADVTIRGSRAFVLGDRGLQVVDLPSGRVEDSVDIEARRAIGSSGRHVVVLDRGVLQVIDAAPWSSSGAAAIGAAAD